jgi:AraC-like DNA-binding protein
MYTLKDGWIAMQGSMPVENWDGKMYCTETDAELTFRTNIIQGFLAAYTFTLVIDGWLSIVYNNRELKLRPGDLYIYSPGMRVLIAAASSDYRAICLMADEHTTIELPSVHDLVHIAYAPIVQLHEPKLSLPPDEVRHMEQRMREIIGYLHSDHLYKKEILRMLYATFLLDMQNAQQHSITQGKIPPRVEEIFIGFIRLLPHHFAEHHDIAFYASALHITPVYLSRVVRQVTGRTVIDYINQMIVMEASFLLRTSPMSITQIAERLHFADTPSFSKFFLRMKGVNPRRYRMEK